MNHEESVAIQKRDAEIASIGKIGKLHEECCRADIEIKEVILRKINSGRECGLELIELKKRGVHGSWEGMFSDKNRTGSVFAFSVDTAQIYMKFARLNPEPITELAEGIRCMKDALIASGAISAPAGHGPQKLHSFDFPALVAKRCFDFKALWGEQIKKAPIETWSSDQKEIVRDELHWYAQTYVELGGRL